MWRLLAEHVGGAGDGQDGEEDDRRHPDPGTERLVPRAVQQVVRAVVVVDLLVDPRPGVHDGEDQPGDQEAGEERVGDLVARRSGTPSAATAAPNRRASPGTSPAGRRPTRCRGVGAVEPHRVDLDQAAEGEDDPGDDHEQAARLQGVLGPDPAAPDVGLGLARAGEVGVFLVPQDHQVGGEQPDDERGKRNSWMTNSRGMNDGARESARPTGCRPARCRPGGCPPRSSR